ncbi:hypothetical protein ACFWFF_38975, partial [Streptomyces sp. NPDC060223]
MPAAALGLSPAHGYLTRESVSCCSRRAAKAVMQAVVLGVDRKIVLESRAEPVLRSDQVMVDVDLCGLCGTDLHA